MSDILAKICADKLEHIALSKGKRSLAIIEAAAKKASPVRGFAASLRRAADNSGFGLIAELKKPHQAKGSFALTLIHRPSPKPMRPVAPLVSRC